MQTAAHTGLGTGIFFAILLVIGAIALGAYSYFRLNRRTIGFQHFEVGRRNNGNMVMRVLSTIQPLALGYVSSLLALKSSASSGCLAHTPCLQGGVSAPKSSSSGSLQPLFLAETEFAEEGGGAANSTDPQASLSARSLAWKQTPQGQEVCSSWGIHETDTHHDQLGFQG